jgi:hypothetical protein
VQVITSIIAAAPIQVRELSAERSSTREVWQTSCLDGRSADGLRIYAVAAAMILETTCMKALLSLKDRGS